MVLEGNRLKVINELLENTDLIAVEVLRKRLGMDRRGIDRDHLLQLKKTGVIEYGSIFKQRNNKPPQSIDAVKFANTIVALKYLVDEYPDILKLHSSPHVQNIINADFVRAIKLKWNYPTDEFIKNRYLYAIFYEDENGRICELPALFKYQIDDATQSIGGNGIRKILSLTKEKRMEMTNDHIKGLANHLFGATLPYLSGEDLLFILKSSPSAFKFALTDVLSQPTDAELSKLREDISLFTMCVFCWEDVPGKDSIRLTNFLEAVGVDWVKIAKIEKSSDNKVITVSDGKNHLSFKLNEGKSKVKINKKSYVLYSKEVKKGCTFVSFLYTDPDTLDKNSLIEIWNQLPEFHKERYISPVKRLIPNNIFSEQIILSFISDVRLGYFVAQPLYSTVLKVGLNVRMSLNGQEMICKEISYETSHS